MDPNFGVCGMILTYKEIYEKEVTVKELIVESRLNMLNLDTILHWMHALGLRYESKKHFYIDTHKTPEVLRYYNELWGP